MKTFNRRNFLYTSGVLALGSVVAPTIAAANDPAAESAPTIFGSGDFRYEYVPAKLPLPAGVKVKNAHGLCRDREENIYFTFESQSVDETTRVLIRYARDGTAPVLLGDPKLAAGVPHGLNIAYEPDGQAFLYHANNQATIHKTTLDGEMVWTQKWPAQMGNFKPTDTIVIPGTDRLLVADGYGSSMIHALRKSDGVYAGKSWGGKGAEHGELNCPHAITFDPRRQLLLTCDRSNKRMEYTTANGLYHSTIDAKEITAPCNVDFWGDYALVPDLGGPVYILDKDNRVVSTLDVGQVLGAAGFKHPHDAIWLENGDIVIGTWNPGRLGYWRRLSNRA
ncbi:MAG: hypothetical protein ACTHLW_01960 [Verrucomicrobiota bacterium]